MGPYVEYAKEQGRIENGSKSNDEKADLFKRAVDAGAPVPWTMEACLDTGSVGGFVISPWGIYDLNIGNRVSLVRGPERADVLRIEIARMARMQAAGLWLGFSEWQRTVGILNSHLNSILSLAL